LILIARRAGAPPDHAIEQFLLVADVRPVSELAGDPMSQLRPVHHTGASRAQANLSGPGESLQMSSADPCSAIVVAMFFITMMSLRSRFLALDRDRDDLAGSIASASARRIAFWSQHGHQSAARRQW
jgi:hypothetical protein